MGYNLYLILMVAIASYDYEVLAYDVSLIPYFFVWWGAYWKTWPVLHRCWLLRSEVPLVQYFHSLKLKASSVSQGDRLHFRLHSLTQPSKVFHVDSGLIWQAHAQHGRCNCRHHTTSNNLTNKSNLILLDSISSDYEGDGDHGRMVVMTRMMAVATPTCGGGGVRLAITHT